MWKNDERDGIGKEIWKDGSSYKGSDSKGKKHGFGTLTF